MTIVPGGGSAPSSAVAAGVLAIAGSPPPAPATPAATRPRGVPLLLRPLLGRRDPVRRDPAAGAFADAVLQRLRADGYSAGAWWTFWTRSWAESMDAVRARGRATAEIHLLHAGLLVGTGDPRTLISWAMAWSHVGLLPAGGGLGAANVLSLVRANLPLIAAARPRLVATVAVLTDLADGAVARQTGTETPFGAYADAMADATFWPWFVRRYEERRWLRRLALCFWLAPPAVVAAAAFAGGRMPAVPRPLIVRTLSAALQATLMIRSYRQRALRP